MNQNDPSEPKLPVSRLKHRSLWLFGSLFMLLVLLWVIPLLVTYFLDFATVKQKIQAVVAAQTGGQLDYRAADFTLLPRPAVELRQISLNIPGQVEGTIGTVTLSPEFLPLLTGQLRLGILELESPVLSLNLPDSRPAKYPAPPYAFPALKKSLLAALEPLRKIAPKLDLLVSNAELTVDRGKEKLVKTEGLTLGMGLAMTDPDSPRANLEGECLALTLYRHGRPEVLKEVKLHGGVRMSNGELTVALDKLTLIEPALELSGSLALAATTPGITLSLSGRNIDVDAARKTALALAGDHFVVNNIFDYLRGGLLSQISFSSRGDTPSELGDLNNILIQGQLQDGKISISEIKLDLDEVNSEVVISKGALQGIGMSTRLAGSYGHDGAMKVGLNQENDLFKLELMLSADLPQLQKILKRVVKTQVFIDEIDKITKLQGTANGKLILGDSLSDIKARVEISELDATADYQRVPFPVVIKSGQVTFQENQVELKDLKGTMGRSDFSGFNCMVNWKEGTLLDISSGQFDLVLDELYPWVATFGSAKEIANEVKQVTGQLSLSAFSLKGAVARPEQWQYSLAGGIKKLTLETSRFPSSVTLTHGDFKLDTEQFSFQNIETGGLDADLVLAGTLKGFPRKLDRVELFVDGDLGHDSFTWLRDLFKVPEAYALQSPLTLAKVQVDWQPNATTSIKGNVSIKKGPDLTIDVASWPQQFKLKRLHIKDQYSDAVMAFSRGDDELSLSFSGLLQHETLEELFVDEKFGEGNLQGDLEVNLPLKKQASATAKGHLEGGNLLFHTSSDDKIALGKIDLIADGSQIKADVVTLSWNDLVWSPFKSTIDFDLDKINVRVTEAKLCGINSPGMVTISGNDLSVDFTLDDKDLDVTTVYTCLTGGEGKMTGRLDSSGQLNAQGEAANLVNALQGPVSMTFTNGTIEQSKLLARLLEVLNVTEIVKGRLPKLGSEGFDYSTLTLQGKFENGKFLIEKLYMDGETLDILGTGDIDLNKETLDIELLAAPFKTANTIVKNLPGVNYIMAGSLVAIPVRIRGELADPKVSVMPVSSIGSSLLGLGGRVLNSPLKLVETLFNWGEEKEK